MATKICILCLAEKELNEFYKHPKMTFGVDSKCKDCVKTRTKLRQEKLREDEDWIKKERERGRKKHHRLYSNIKNKKLDENGYREGMK